MTIPITAPAAYVPQSAVAFSAPDGAALVSVETPCRSASHPTAPPRRSRSMPPSRPRAPSPSSRKGRATSPSASPT